MPLTRSARLFIAVAIGLASCCVFNAFAVWEFTQPAKFALLLLIALPAATARVWIPGVETALSLSFLFVLAAITEFGTGQAIIVALMTSLVAEARYRTPETPLWKIAFRSSNAVLATALGACVEGWAGGHLTFFQEPLHLTLVAAVYFKASTLPNAIVECLNTRRSVVEIWREAELWALPYYLVGAGFVFVLRLITHVGGWQAGLLTLPVIYLLFHSSRSYTNRLRDEKLHADELRRRAEIQERHASELAGLHLRTIEALALAIEAKDFNTHDHLQRVQTYAVEIGRELKLSDSDTDALRAGSVLHDIGKLAVPEHILSKPGKLSAEEFEKMKIHPIVGAEILQHVKFPYPVVDVVRSHHEKWNGTGYPDGLQGEQIPVGARILAAVDCLDALASYRQYRRALSLDKAMEMVVAESGISFDPQIVAILQRRYREFEQILASGRAEGVAEHVYPRSATTSSVLTDHLDGSAAGHRLGGLAAPIDFLASIASARQEVQALFELSQDLGNSLSLHDTLSMLSHRLKHLVPHDTLAVYIRREQTLHPEFVIGDDFRLFNSLCIPFGQGLSGWVAENKTPILNGNPSVEPGYLNDPTKFSTLRAAVSVPLEGVEGVSGVLTLYHVQRDAFSRDHLRILLAISSKLALSVENTLRFRQAEDSATNDYLTGLPNIRSLFIHLDSEVSRCRREQKPLAVLIGDLNGFKQVNDRFGHLEGNRLLQVVARALRQQCRPYDFVARIGGDEFVIIAAGLTDEQVHTTCERFSQSVIDVGCELFQEHILSLSIGAAHFPADGIDAEQLIAAADRSMYKAKRRFKEGEAERSLLRLAAGAGASSNPVNALPEVIN